MDNSKPSHYNTLNASRFQQKSIVENYKYRLSYSREVFQKLHSLLVERNGSKDFHALDIGTGTGEIAKKISQFVNHVDAIDVSSLMIEEAQKGEKFSNISWIIGKIEELSFIGTYDLIIAGDSIHWMNWTLVFPLFKKILSQNGFLALLTRDVHTSWDQQLGSIIKKYSLVQDFTKVDLPDLLERKNYWKIIDHYESPSMQVSQPVHEYIQSFHSTTSFSLEDMKTEDGKLFDQEIKEIVHPFISNGLINLESVSILHWGIPLFNNS